MHIRLYPRIHGGSTSVPEEGACPLGLGFESQWDDTNTMVYDSTEDHEKIIRRRRKSLVEKLSEEERQVCVCVSVRVIVSRACMRACADSVSDEVWDLNMRKYDLMGLYESLGV